MKTVCLTSMFALLLALPTQAAESTAAKQVADTKDKVSAAKEGTKSTAKTTTSSKETHKKTPTTKKKVKTKLPIGKTDTVITMGDLHCKHCAKKVSGKLYTVKGVQKVRTDVKADVAIVTPQKNKKLSTKALWSAAQKAGFQPTELVGPAGKFVADAKTKGPKLVPQKVKSAKEKVAKKPA